jgi:V-type H+-transporting ATPase subunit d
MNDAHRREEKRGKYMANLGYLYPERYDRLIAVVNARDFKDALDGTDYSRLLNDANMDEGQQMNEAEESKTQLDDVMLHEQSRQYSMSFENGFHFGVFYGYLKLKELEIKNVTWLDELVSLDCSRAIPGWNKYTVPFKYHRNQISGTYE